jgi:hypothetical protein
MDASQVIEVRPPLKKRNIYEHREGESDESFIFNNIGQLGADYNKKPKEN